MNDTEGTGSYAWLKFGEFPCAVLTRSDVDETYLSLINFTSSSAPKEHVDSLRMFDMMPTVLGRTFNYVCLGFFPHQ